ncbi:dnaJ homolog subfamily C member 12-like isoform X1 [Dermacentor variabilis]|uniref:dnaJ homolog subfamily C member 12-like isoform X1 n=1 Tax=Dermacentor variabilis TaxID=34621 RepID=UPI003F5B169D
MESLLEDVMKGRCKAQPDYYEILGCDEISSDEQLLCEYKVKALKFHPDKNPGDPEAAQQFQNIQEARDVLLDPEKRKKYDKWRKSGLSMPFQQYVNLNVTSLHWVTKKTKEPMLMDCCHQAPMQVCVDDSSDALSSWRSKEPADELLRKFRNYEI